MATPLLQFQVFQMPFRKQTIVINGVSKTYAMTGWRVGFAVGDPEIISGMAKIISKRHQILQQFLNMLLLKP